MRPESSETGTVNTQQSGLLETPPRSRFPRNRSKGPSAPRRQRGGLFFYVRFDSDILNSPQSPLTRNAPFSRGLRAISGPSELNAALSRLSLNRGLGVGAIHGPALLADLLDGAFGLERGDRRAPGPVAQARAPENLGLAERLL